MMINDDGIGVHAIIVSNHGGRQLDFSRSGIEVLAEVMDALKAIGAEKKIEVTVQQQLSYLTIHSITCIMYGRNIGVHGWWRTSRD